MWYPSALTPSQKKERRLEGGRLLCEGRLTHAQIAARLGVTTQAVGQWAKALGPNAGGLGALRGRRPTGRPPLLTPEQWEEVLGILAQGALDAGFETERWTLRRIRQVILKQFGVDYHPNYLAERLKASGWTAQVPAVQARERDEELVRAWLQRDWPRIKKARRKGAEIVFVDETGFSFRSRTGSTWAPAGQTPILRRISKRREVTTAVGLTLSGRIYKRHFDHAVHGPDMVLFLAHLRRKLAGAMIVLWDGLSVHKSDDVKIYLAEHPEISVETLPPYAPDLNPEEECHGNVKQRLRNAAPETTNEIRNQVDRGFARLRRRPDVVLEFFRHAGLRVKQLS